MKAGEKPQLSEAWWTKNKAKTLLDGTLTKALAAYEKPYKKFVADPTQTAPLKEADAALKKLPGAVADTIKKCNGTLHKETIECLKKFDPLIKAKAKDFAAELQRRDKISGLTLENVLGGPLKPKLLKFLEQNGGEDIAAYFKEVGPQTKGSVELFNKFISANAPSELNLQRLQSEFCEVGDKTLTIPRKDIEKCPWDKAYKKVGAECSVNFLVSFQASLRRKENILPALLE